MTSAAAIVLDDLQWETAPPAPKGRDAWRRFRRNRMAVAGLAVVAAMALAALSAPLLVRVGVLADPYRVDIRLPHAGVSRSHPFGTDALGRDLLSRTIFGARISLSIGVLLQVLVLVIGGGIGLVAGFRGGVVGSLLMRLTDVMYAFPDLLFVLVVAAVLGPGYWHVFLAVGLSSWPFLARLVRAQALTIREQDYVAAARASGSRSSTIVVRHVVPNALGPVVVTLAFGIPAVIFTEAFLSFVGVGLRPPVPSWGVMVNEGYQAIFAFPREVIVPAAAIALATTAFNFIGDGLRDALDPRVARR